MKPIEEFYCDTCEQIIDGNENGYVEWLSFLEDKETNLVNGFRICHNKENCFIHSSTFGHSSLPLTEFLGKNGHILLLKMIDIGPFHEPKYSHPRIKDFREYSEFFRRLTIPYYEEARQWWNEAINDGYFDEIGEVSIYMPERLKAMIEHYTNNGDVVKTY